MGARDQGVDPTGRYVAIVRTLCFLTNGGDVLLLERARTKKAFPGRVNGVGGHVERDEDPLHGAQREILEESGLHVPLTDLTLRGVWSINVGGATGNLLFIFTASVPTKDGTLAECLEGTLMWVPIGEALKLNVADGLPELWPRLFNTEVSDRPFFAHIDYDDADKAVIRFA
jgi:8-oxo-dGTP diphosphatase